MPAYVIANVDVKDADRSRTYIAMAPESIAAHGGRYLARGGACEVKEGNWTPKRLVILEFRSMAAARDWWESEDYRPARELRNATADTELVILEGL